MVTAMEGFQYTHGDTPLDGYVIQRAVGRGGFGEVYYAISDAGREVALKVLHGYEQIEVRGVSQCMNLKSPHLVTIFDIKRNAEGKTFVVMEYVNGPPLKELIEQSPSGLGTAKSAFFLRELGKGLSFLHDRGIVHRDLKPGNIFYEDGYVKIGDYGLSKSIGVSRHSGQTITVGTVQYMAPEVGVGRYDRSIDIYALGVVLYEMLTGQVPFFGSSHGEILMKHLVAQPDLTGIEEPFAGAIRKAMAKEPAERFQSVQEMVEAVFGADHVRNSVSCFSPDSLTMVAGRVAQNVAVGAASGGGHPARRAGGTPAPHSGSSATHDGGYGTYRPPVTDDSSDVWGRVAKGMDEAGRHIREGVGRIRLGRLAGDSAAAEPGDVDAGRDPLTRGQRRNLGLMAVLAVAFGMTWVGKHPPNWAVIALVVVPATSLALLWAHRRFGDRLHVENAATRGLSYGGPAAVALLACSPVVCGLSGRDLSIMVPLILAVLCVDWRQRMLPQREERVSLSAAFTAAIAGWFFALFISGPELAVGGILAGISFVVQVVARFDPAARRRVRPAASGAAHSTGHGPAPRGGGGVPSEKWAGGRADNSDISPARTPDAAACGPTRVVPGWVRTILIGLFVFLCGTGILLLTFAGLTNSNDEAAAAVCGGVGALLVAVLCLVRGCTRTIGSYWGGLVKPLLMLLCIQSVIISAVVMGFENHLTDDELLIGLAFIVFPVLLLVVLLFVSDSTVRGWIDQVRGSIPQPDSRSVSDKDAFVALMLASAGFVGLGGLHRFYTGKIGTGILWLLTFGCFMVGTIVDVVTIAMGLFKDRFGRPLQIWMGIERVRPPGSGPGALSEWPAAQTREPFKASAPRAGGGETQDHPPDLRPAAPAAVQVHRPSRPLLAPTATNRWLAAIGGLLMFCGLIVGVGYALGVPHLIATGFPDPHLASALSGALGYSGWPRLLMRILQLVAIGLLLAGGTTLVIARRRSGAAHTGRAVLGFIAMIMAITAFREACDHIDWMSTVSMFETNRVGPALEAVMDRIDGGVAAMAVMLFVAASLVLAWPERRERLDIAEARGT